MTKHIQWTLEMNVREGRLDEVQPLIDAMVAATQETEPGALIYEYYLSDDKTRCTVIERYADSDAVMTHLQNFQTKFAETFFATFEPVLFRVFGPANDDVKGALAALGATFDGKTGGFIR